MDTKCEFSEVIPVPDTVRVTVNKNLVMWTHKNSVTEKEEIVLEKEAMLSLLLINEVVFLNEFHWRRDWPEDAKQSTAIVVNCNDIFIWAGADGEAATFSDIADVYWHWAKDPEWGAAVWCIKKRNQFPQNPVYKKIKEKGIWDIDNWDLGPSL